MIGCRRLHGGGLGAHQMCSCPCGVHKRRIALQLLDHLLVFFAGLDRRYAEGNDFQAPQIAPFPGKDFVQCASQLHGMARQGRISDAHVGDSGKCGLKCGEKLRFELSIQPIPGIVLGDIAADIGIEQNGVADAVAVLAEAADGNVNVDAGPLVNHTEGNRRRRAVLVANQLLRIEVVNPLILGRFSAEGEALADVLEGIKNAGSQVAGKNRRLCGAVIDEFPRLCAKLRNLSLIDNNHALAVGHGYNGAVGDDIFAAFVV